MTEKEQLQHIVRTKATSKSTSMCDQPEFFDIGSEADGVSNSKVTEDIKDVLLALRADCLSLSAQKVNQRAMTVAGEVIEEAPLSSQAEAMCGAFPKESAGAAKDEQESDQDDAPSTQEAPGVGRFIIRVASTVDSKLQPPPGAAPQLGEDVESAQKESAVLQSAVSAGVVNNEPECDRREAVSATEASEVGRSLQKR